MPGRPEPPRRVSSRNGEHGRGLYGEAGPVPRISREGRPVLVNDVTAGPQMALRQRRPWRTREMMSSPVSVHGPVSSAFTSGIWSAGSAPVAACIQAVGGSGPGARDEAGRAAVRRRPRCGSHTAHAAKFAVRDDDLGDRLPDLGVKPGRQRRDPVLVVTPAGSAFPFRGAFLPGPHPAVQSLARAVLTRRRISGSAGTRCVAPAAGACAAAPWPVRGPGQGPARWRPSAGTPDCCAVRGC